MRPFSNTRLCDRVNRVHIDSDSCWSVAKVDIGMGWFAFALTTLHDWLAQAFTIVIYKGKHDEDSVLSFRVERVACSL